jgi:hypothetical protein
MAYPQGSFIDFLQAACSQLALINLAQPRLGAEAIRQRLTTQRLSSPPFDRDHKQDRWLIYQGGLNSVETPARTNEQIRQTFVAAHRAGLKVMGISLLPWGSEHDRRWSEIDGLQTWHSTRQVVDFVLGRLSPAEALGPYGKHHPAEWNAEELPDIAVDVYDSALRDFAAPLRPAQDVRTLVRQTPWIQRQFRGLLPAEQEEHVTALVNQTLALPQWFMHKRFHAVDHIHPNRDGHRLVAQLACDKAPATWGCDCGAIEDMRWNPQKGGLEPVVSSSLQQPSIMRVTP